MILTAVALVLALIGGGMIKIEVIKEEKPKEREDEVEEKEDGEGRGKETGGDVG